MLPYDLPAEENEDEVGLDNARDELFFLNFTRDHAPADLGVEARTGRHVRSLRPSGSLRIVQRGDALRYTYSPYK